VFRGLLVKGFLQVMFDSLDFSGYGVDSYSVSKLKGQHSSKVKHSAILAFSKLWCRGGWVAVLV
jgi:hypothetical protein